MVALRTEFLFGAGHDPLNPVQVNVLRPLLNRSLSSRVVCVSASARHLVPAPAGILMSIDCLRWKSGSSVILIRIDTVPAHDVRLNAIAQRFLSSWSCVLGKTDFIRPFVQALRQCEHLQRPVLQPL